MAPYQLGYLSFLAAIILYVNTVSIMKKVHNEKEAGADFGGIINASLGLSGEVGELNDMIKKWVFHGHELDIYEVQKEIGDICWHLAMMCESFGLSMDRAMELNINKLKRRYPDGFSEISSINRTE